MTNWGQELERLRAVGDPLIDDAIAAELAAHPQPDPRSLFGAVVADLQRAKREAAPYAGPLAAALDQAHAWPAWADDEARLRRGQEVFNRYGLEMGAALVFAALPLAYASRDGAQALGRVSDLANTHLLRRVGETGQMIVDVMDTRGGTPSLQPGGRGHVSAVGLRLLHGCARALLADPARPDAWPAALDLPLNQSLMVATLLDFTLVTWKALERMGVELTAEERADHLHVWSVVGCLMGVEVCQQGPLTLADVDDIAPELNRKIGATEHGRKLTAVLLAGLEHHMPLGSRKLPRSAIWWFFHDADANANANTGAGAGLDQVPELLGVPPPAWWARLVFSRAERLEHLGRRPVIGPVWRAVMRHLGRLVFLGFADGFAPGPPMFHLPDELASSWHLGVGPTRTRFRLVRRTIRGGARTLTRTVARTPSPSHPER